MSNPAMTAVDLQLMFPPGVAAAELRGPGDVSLLLPAEAEFLGRAVPKRAQEFAAGRLCARRALAQFGLSDFAVRVAHDRQPVWPPSMVGSIAHTDGYCAAVAAPRREFAAIGIDCEVCGRVTGELWETIGVPQELEWLASLEEPQRPRAATLLFAAKEAFYKCQYPSTGEWLDFADLHIEVRSFKAPGAEFRVVPTRSIKILERAPRELSGRYRFHDGLVTAAIALAPQ